MATNGQDVPHGDVHAVSGASATQDANAPVSTSNSTGKIGKAHSGNGPEKTEAEIYHERVGCGLFWAVGKFRPTNYMIVSLCTIKNNVCFLDGYNGLPHGKGVPEPACQDSDQH